MKKLSLLLCLVSTFQLVHSQDVSTSELIKRGNLQKTGNRLDVFTNFFQAAVRDLTGKERSLDFKSTVFALRVKLDPSLNIDTNYVKHRFDRNFQFNTGLKLDTAFRFKSFSAEFTWAIINKRDSTILSFIGKPEDSYFNEFSIAITDALNNYRIQEGLNVKFREAESMVKAMLASGKVELNKLPAEFRRLIPELETTQRVYDQVVSAFDSALVRTRKMPLLTVSVNTLFKNQTGVFNGGNAEIVYLQGLSRNNRPIELDLRGYFKSTDTLVSEKRYRNEIGFTGGFNWGILISRSNKAPLFEIKPHFEYKRVLRGLVPGEEQSYFLANAEARIRITKNFWIPLTLKYDLENNDFLGFLNVAINWDAFNN